MPWLLASALPKGLRSLRVLHRLVDAELRSAERGRGLADAVLVEEVLHHLQALALAAEDGAVRHAHVGERMCAWSVGMLNVHRYSSTSKPGALRGHQERGDAVAVAGLAAGAGHDHVVLRVWMPVFHVFSPLITHSSPSRTAVVSMWVASLPWFGSVMPNANPRVPSPAVVIHSAFCSSVP
jgi:hypothetical protein